MAAMDNVDTNTDTEANNGNTLQREGVGDQGQKLQVNILIEYQEYSLILFSPVFNFCKCERHGDPALPQIRDSKIHNKQISINNYYLASFVQFYAWNMNLAFLRFGLQMTAPITRIFSTEPPECEVKEEIIKVDRHSTHNASTRANKNGTFAFSFNFCTIR